MKTTSLRALASLSVILGYVGSASGEEVWTAPARHARKANPVTPSPEGLRAARQLFEAACLPCHGVQGKGDGPLAGSMPTPPPDLTGARLREQSDGELFWKITNGRVPMPAYREAFTDEQRWRLVNYIRGLAPISRGNDRSTIVQRENKDPTR